MIAGRGVTHSERGREVTHLIPETANGAKVMHGLQMWVALQKEQEDCEPSFGFATEGVPILEDVDGVDAQLMLGSALGKTQSALDATQPLFLIDLTLNGGVEVALPFPPNTEVGLHPLGPIEVGPERARLEASHLGMCVTTQEESLIRVRAPGDSVRVILYGGPPLPEKRHIVWNFASTSMEKINTAVEAWASLDRSMFPLVVNEDNLDSIPIPKPRQP